MFVIADALCCVGLRVRALRRPFVVCVASVGIVADGRVSWLLVSSFSCGFCGCELHGHPVFVVRQDGRFERLVRGGGGVMGGWYRDVPTAELELMWSRERDRLLRTSDAVVGDYDELLAMRRELDRREGGVPPLPLDFEQYVSD